MFFFATFWTVGKLTFGYWTEGAIWGAVMLVSGWALFRLWARMKDPADSVTAAAL
ncbi:MAG: hypothetical protein QM747_13610 [Nocardioides sp.]